MRRNATGRDATSTTSENDYVIRIFDDPGAIDADAWNALVEAQASAMPFMRHEYLLALHRSHSAVESTGWQAQFLAVFADDQLIAACPLYLKEHSYGEYVFDWAWADAYRRHGLAYYPKLLNAVPFTPVPGPGRLATPHEQRLLLLRGIEAICRQAELSSAHLLFLDDADQAAAAEA